jgi:gamma-glutamyltranspeptidase/glutathione hydrolase
MAMLIAGGDVTNGQSQDPRADEWRASGERGAIVTGNRLAADAGLEMLKSGGNAVDAAVSALLVQSVVESSLACFGGELPIMVYDAKRGVVEVVVGLGAAPRLATVEWFRENRNGVIQGRGDIANGVVPGHLDACLTALDRYGTRSFAECAQPMLRILEERGAMLPDDVLKNMRRRGPDFDAARWIDDHKNLRRTIERLLAAESLASGDRRRGLRLVADYFYRGPIAREIDAWSQTSGGLLRYSDLAQHHTRVEDPLTIAFQDHEICKCDVWSQGPFALQTLRLLQTFELSSLQPNSARVRRGTH